MAEVRHYVVEGWEPTILALRQAGFPAVLTTCAPGWWFVQIVSEDPRDSIFVGSHFRDIDEPTESSVHIEGPSDFFLAYRQFDGGIELFVSDDLFTETCDVDQLIPLLRQLAALAPSDLKQLV